MVADPIDFLDNLRCCNQGVAPNWHGGWSGMALLADHRNFVPALALSSCNDANGPFLSFQDWPLFYMQLKIGADFMCAWLLLPGITDALKFVAKGKTVQVSFCPDFVQLKDPGEHTRTHHGWSEAATFLIGPTDDLDRSFAVLDFGDAEL